MKELLAAYKEFWSQFYYHDIEAPQDRKELAAFREGYVRVRKGDKFEKPEFPYIVYPTPKPNFTESAIVQVSVWDKPPHGMTAIGYQDRITHITEQIEGIIGADGVILLLNKGSLKLNRGNPWVNMVPGDDKDLAIVRAVFNVIVENYTM
jgi:hypothetical protein